MSSSNDFLGFEDKLHFFAFITQVLYNLVPINFMFFLFYGYIQKERASILGITFLYSNAFIYFWTSIYHKNTEGVNHLDFCNLIGFFFGLIYFIFYHYILYYEKDLKRFLIPIISLIVISILIFIIISIFVNKKENFVYILFNWYIGTILNILENLPLGFDIIYLIKNKISEKFTLLGASVGFINNIIWLIWAIKKVNIGENRDYSIIANIFAICLHILIFFLFFIFMKKKPDINENKNSENFITPSDDSYIEDKAEKKEEKEIIDNFM